MPGKIPVLLVTGFLGSGKTTLLRRLAASRPDWRMIFLVNEIADKSVDQLALDATGTPTHSVVGGSLFCECKAGDFIRVMKEQVAPQHRKNPLHALVIETSGIADPEAIGELMATHGISDDFEIRRILCVVAPKRFMSLLRNMPSVQAQIRTSDLILLNKTDLSDEATTAAVEGAIHEENPDAEIRRTTYCETDFDLSHVVRELPNHPLFTCEANPFSTETVTWPEDRSVDQARDWLSALPPTILRVKGLIHTPEGIWRVERTVDSLELESIAESGNNSLVLIAHDDHEKDLKAAVHLIAV